MNDRKYFLIFCILSIVLVGIIFGINGIMRGTNASFGGVTGVLGDPYKVIYYANWPDKTMGDDSTEYNVGKIYQILDNMYAVPSGYEFLGWGTEPDGQVVYNAFRVLSLSSDLNLYAIWGLIDTGEGDNTEETVTVFGDSNIDGIVNENDYLLIDSYLLDNSLLSGQGLINADVNTDGKVDNIDSDIIKQAILGTEGYVGFLPDKPILIYELYVEDDSNDGDVPTEDDNENGDSSSDEDGNISSGGGNGSGTSGSGGSSAGSGNSSSGNGTGGNKPSGGSNNNSSKPSSSQSGKEENKEDEKPTIYEFKFMNGNMEYAITSCDILQDGTCKLVLPSTIPSKVGYVFNGWSLDKDCDAYIIKESMTVKAGGTYYACYIKISSEEKEKNNFNIWIILFGVWALASILIYRLLKQFKNKEIN